MIHYTLLPEKEIKTLKREYRIRLAIFLLFFMSCAVFVGTGSLVPAYVFSYSQEKETVSRLESFQKDRKDRGINEVSKSLNDINEVTKRIKDYKNSVEYSKIISPFLRFLEI